MIATKPRIYADFHNADAQGRVRLNCEGTLADLADQGLELHEGLSVTLYDDDGSDGKPASLTVDGLVSYSSDEQLYVAAVDWSALQREGVSVADLSNGVSRDPSVVSKEPDRRSQ